MGGTAQNSKRYCAGDHNSRVMVLAVNGGVEALALSMTTTVLDGLIACYNWPQLPVAVNGGCAACAPGSKSLAHCGREWEGGSIATAGNFERCCLSLPTGPWFRRTTLYPHFAQLHVAQHACARLMTSHISHGDTPQVARRRSP
eukprot:scaffold2072_cov126-Isochrysis_galbana.AAC.15